MIFKDGVLTIDGNNVSDVTTQVGLNRGRQSKMNSAMGDDTEIFEAGVRTVGFSTTHKSEQGAGGIEAILDGIDDAGDPVEIVLRFSSEAVSEENPQWTGDFILESYNPLEGNWGDKLFIKANWKPASSLTRATSA